MKCIICNTEIESNPFSNKICVSCYKEKEFDYKKYIYSSNYKKSKPVFYKEKYENNKKLYCGIELEIQGLDMQNKKDFIFDQCHNKFIYFKRDASMNNYGVEIVSDPASLHYHLLNWKNIFNSLKRYNMTDTSNCGLHFHFSREAFTQKEIALIDYFINNHFNLIKELGGRYNSIYASIIQKPYECYGKPYKKDRYVAFNLNNKNTVEMRFCASTNDYDLFLDRLMNVYIIINFCLKKYDLLDTESETLTKFNDYKYEFKKKCLKYIKNKKG